MAELNLTGIDRSNSNENGVPEAASLIINARKKGSTWEYVGDKIEAGVNMLGNIYPHGYFWHYKIKGWYYWNTDYYDKAMGDANFNKTDILISVCDCKINGVQQIKTIDILQFTKYMGYVDFFRDSGGKNQFKIPFDEEYLSLHSLNDIVILDTDKNKYYFVWDEEKYTFVQLPELDDFEISVSATPKEIDFGEIFELDKNSEICTYARIFDNDTYFPTHWDIDPNKGEFNLSSIRDANTFFNTINTDSCRNEYAKLSRLFISKLRDKIIELGYLWKGFRVVAAIELIDGRVLKTSNIVDFIDDFFSHSTKNYNPFVKSTPLIRVGTHKNRLNAFHQTIFIYSFGSFSYSDYNSGKSYYQGTNKIKCYKDIKISFNSNFYNNINIWIKHNLIQNIAVYVTDCDDFLDETKNVVVPPVVNSNIETIKYEFRPTGVYITFPIYIPYDKKKLFDIETPYYKIGNFDIQNKKNSFEIEAKFFKDVVSKKPLLLDQDLSKKYVSRVNNIYNGMIHKSCVNNIVDTKNIIHNYKNNLNNIDIFVDVKIKDKWYRYRLDGVYNGSNLYTVKTNRIEFTSINIQDANFLIFRNGIYKIIKKLELKKSPFTNNILVFPIVELLYHDNGAVGVPVHGIPTDVATFDGNMIIDVCAYFKDWVLRVDNNYFNSLPSVNYKIENLINFPILYYEDTNRLQLSATENPFIYPSKRSYRFGNSNNKVISCETSTVGMSDAKFGMLPLYVFTKQGLWVMETGQGDMAYISQHLLENIHCFDNHRLICRVLGGVVFGADNGIYVVSGTRLTKLTDKLEGRVVLNDIKGIQNRIESSISQSQNVIKQPDIGDPDYFFVNGHERIDNIMQEYFTEKSFCVYDKIENELLFIEPTKYFSFVLMLNDMSWTTRADFPFRDSVIFNGYGAETANFNDFVEINNHYILIKNRIPNPPIPKRCWHYFYKLEETTTSKSSSNITNNAVVFASGVIMTNQYTKIEHIIARFNQITNSEFDSHIFLIGSRDGIEWKVLNHSFAKFPKGVSGQEMRRCFTSARYFQFVYIRIERGKQNTSNRKDSYFERFTFDMSNSDARGKIR